MAKLYFCGTDTYNCLPINRTECNANTDNKIYFKPCPLDNVSKLEFTHFYSVYQKTNSRTCYSWFINGLGLPETQIFGSALCITNVAVCKNSIVGLSQDGNLYKISLEADDENGELLSFRTSAVRMDEDLLKTPFTRIAANESNVYTLQCTAQGSKIYRIEDRIESVAEFPGKHIVEFSVGLGHFVALSDTGALWNWGNAGRSEVAGDANEVRAMAVCDTPQRVEFFDDLPCIILKVVCGGWHTLALTSDGDIYSWGWNESGQLGHGTAIGSKSDPYPIELGSAQDPVIDIAAGSRHSVALLKSGQVYSWGRNKEGQVGLEANKELSAAPQQIEKSWDGTAIKIKCTKWASIIFTDQNKPNQ